MNRIILIGNGFDLAHGMKTSYSDFLKYLWSIYTNDINEAYSLNVVRKPFENDDIAIGPPKYLWNKVNSYNNLLTELNDQKTNIVFKNHFLEAITIYEKNLNWVDIENHYYYILKKIYNNEINDYSINQLNNDFNKIKIHLINYLNKVEEENKDFNDSRIISRIKEIVRSEINYRDTTLQELNNKIKEVASQSLRNDIEIFINEDLDISELPLRNRKLIYHLAKKTSNGEEFEQCIRKLLTSPTQNEYFDFTVDDTLFLNFNYTDTHFLYNTKDDIVIHIHGSLNKNNKNPVIFGFGDEIDEDYKFIENLNNNDYLENVKSIKYLETDNYRKLLEYINSDSFQVFILGHSCGISDRTLLNTLFEHQNCVSIKPYYYKKSETEDNYSDIVRNISRNFSSNIEMREKVVNKIFCESLL